jgi:hypothetical protein
MQIFRWIRQGIAPDPTGQKQPAGLQAIVRSPGSPTGAVTLGIAIGFCTALIVFGWALLLAGLLYVASDESIATWLLTALALAAGQVTLAVLCWRFAAKPWRTPHPANHDGGDDGPPNQQGVQ